MTSSALPGLLGQIADIARPEAAFQAENPGTSFQGVIVSREVG